MLCYSYLSVFFQEKERKKAGVEEKWAKNNKDSRTIVAFIHWIVPSTKANETTLRVFEMSGLGLMKDKKI